MKKFNRGKGLDDIKGKNMQVNITTIDGFISSFARRPPSLISHLIKQASKAFGVPMAQYVQYQKLKMPYLEMYLLSSFLFSLRSQPD